MPPLDSEALWTAVDRYLNDLLLPPDPALSATAVQTAGSKGYDGFAIIRVLAL